MSTRVHCGQCGSAVAPVDRYCRDCGHRQAAFAPVFFPMSRVRLAALYLGTLGLFTFAWFYRQWRGYAEHRGQRIWSFWRSVGFPVTSSALFDAVNAEHAARAAPFTRPVKLPGRSLAMALMLLVWAVPLLAPGPWKLAFLLGFVPLLPVQAAINRLNPGHNHRDHRPVRLSPWLAVPILPGSAAAAYLVAAALGLTPPSDVLAGGTMSARQYAIVRDLAELEEGERIEFFYSAARLSYAADGNVVTDRRLVSYFTDPNGLRGLDWVGYEQVRSVHAFAGRTLLSPTTIVACIGGGEWLTLYSSGVWDQDTRMIEAIRARVPRGTEVGFASRKGFACPQDVPV